MPSVMFVPLLFGAEKIGDGRIANMVMMGALSQTTGAVKLDHADEILKTFFPPSKHGLIPMNIKAIEAGKQACLSCE
jgi:2-oxoglutarate ferredoxin oxidoreductase subunit gamma